MNYKLVNFSLSFFLSRSLFSLLGLSLLIQLDSSMAIVDIVIGTIFGILFLKTLPTLPQMMQQILGFLLALVGTILFAFTLHLSISKDTSMVILLAIILVATFYFSKSSHEQSGYFAGSLFLVTLILTVITWIGLVPNIHIEFLSGFRTDSILSGSILYFLMSTLPMLLLKKEERNITAYVSASLLHLITTLFVFFTLGMTLSSFYPLPNFIMLSEIEYLEVIRRIDSFLFFPDLCAGVILLTYSYHTVRGVMQTSNYPKTQV